MRNLRSRFSKFSTRYWRKPKREVWQDSLRGLVMDMKQVLEGAKDPQSLRHWPTNGGYKDVKKFLQRALKYIEDTTVDGM